MRAERIALVGAMVLAGVSASGLDLPVNRLQALEMTPTIDGFIDPAEWPRDTVLRLSRAFHPEHAIRLYFACDANNLYLAAFVEDGQLWADGNGGGSGRYWETWNDDGIEWYIDPNGSRDNVLRDSDRLLAVNIGNLGDPENGGGIVSRRSFNRGTNDGGATGTAGPGIMPAGLYYAVRHFGTVNNAGDTDTGYSIEVAIPWSAILMAPPADGTSIGLNAIVVSDDTGGTRDWSDNRDISPPSARFTTPVRPDEYVELRCGTQSGSQSGLTGPVNYQVLQLHRRTDVTAPSAVSSLAASQARPYSVKLNWNAPGDNGNQGYAANYDIRYATSALTAANVDSAARWPAQPFPNAPGANQNTRVMGLVPDTDFWFAVRATDEAGNRGPASIIGPVRTPTLTAAGVRLAAPLYHGAVRTTPAGRYFMTEDGGTFIPVGHHLLMQDKATRYLYPGPVWTGSGYHTFSQDPGALQTVTDYLDGLRESGVTVMRLFLEEHSLNVPNNGDFGPGSGGIWVEFPRGNYNADMGRFLTDMLRLCAERGLHVMLVPFDTFLYDDYLQRTCWGTSNGGPLDDINQFFNNATVLQMCKDRWSWVINTVIASGYADAVFGYDLLNEWDSWEWTRPNADPNTDAAIRANFVAQLAAHVRSIDPEHLILSSNTAWDPRGALAAISYYSDIFDASVPHLYLPGNREPWNNPAAYKGTAVVQQQTREIAWWTLNRLNRIPVLNGEWGPSDGWFPAGFTPTESNTYPPGFTETDDNYLTRLLWFTELCSGAAGPGLRLQGGVRAYDHDLFLSDYMRGVQSTLSHFVENRSLEPAFGFTDFASENWRGHAGVENTTATVLLAACADGRRGLAHLVQDRNRSAVTIQGATLRIDNLKTARAQYKAEFWATTPNQTAPAAIVGGSVSGTSVRFSIPAFSDDWAVRFYISNGATGEPESKMRIPVDFGGAVVWWDAMDGVSGQWLNVPGSGWVTDPSVLVVPNVKDNRWYYVGVWDLLESRWLMCEWFGRLQ